MKIERKRKVSNNVKSFKVKKKTLKNKKKNDSSGIYNLIESLNDSKNTFQQSEHANNKNEKIGSDLFLKKISLAKDLCKTLERTLNDLEVDYLYLTSNQKHNKENEKKIKPISTRKSLRKEVQRVLPLINGHSIHTNPIIKLSRMKKFPDNNNDETSLVIKNQSISITTNQTEIEKLSGPKVHLPRLPINIIQGYLNNSNTTENNSHALIERPKNNVVYHNLNNEFKLKTPIVPLYDIRVILQESTISIKNFERKKKHLDFINSLLREDPLEGPSYRFS